MTEAITDAIMGSVGREDLAAMGENARDLARSLVRETSGLVVSGIVSDLAMGTVDPSGASLAKVVTEISVLTWKAGAYLNHRSTINNQLDTCLEEYCDRGYLTKTGDHKAAVWQTTPAFRDAKMVLDIYPDIKQYLKDHAFTEAEMKKIGIYPEVSLYADSRKLNDINHRLAACCARAGVKDITKTDAEKRFANISFVQMGAIALQNAFIAEGDRRERGETPAVVPVLGRILGIAAICGLSEITVSEITVILGKAPMFETVARGRIAKLRKQHASHLFNGLLFRGSTESAGELFEHIAEGERVVVGRVKDSGKSSEFLDEYASSRCELSGPVEKNHAAGEPIYMATGWANLIKRREPIEKQHGALTQMVHLHAPTKACDLHGNTYMSAGKMGKIVFTVKELADGPLMAKPKKFERFEYNSKADFKKGSSRVDAMGEEKLFGGIVGPAACSCQGGLAEANAKGQLIKVWKLGKGLKIDSRDSVGNSISHTNDMATKKISVLWRPGDWAMGCFFMQTLPQSSYLQGKGQCLHCAVEGAALSGCPEVIACGGGKVSIEAFEQERQKAMVEGQRYISASPTSPVAGLLTPPPPYSSPPSSPRPGGGGYFVTSDARGDKIVPMNTTMPATNQVVPATGSTLIGEKLDRDRIVPSNNIISVGGKAVSPNKTTPIGDQGTTDNLISFDSQGTTDNLISFDSQGAANNLISFDSQGAAKDLLLLDNPSAAEDLMPLADQGATNDTMSTGDEIAPTKQAKSEDETVAPNNITSIEQAAVSDLTSIEKAAVSDLTSIEKAAVSNLTSIEQAAVGDLTSIEQAAVSDLTTIEQAAVSDLTSIEKAAVGDLTSIEKAAVSDLTSIEKAAVSDLTSIEKAAVGDLTSIEQAAAGDLTDLTRQLVPSVNIRSFATKLGNSITQKASASTNRLSTSITQLSGSITQFSGSIPQLSGSIPNLSGSIPKLSDSITKLSGSTLKLTDSTPSLTDSTPKPTGATPKPTGATHKPTGTIHKPTGATPKPTGATPKPTGATPKPTGATPKPTGATPKPTGATPKPTGATPKPTGAAPKPTGATPKPTGATPKPTGATPKPTGATPKPTGATPKPTGAAPKPTGATPKPTGATPKPTGATPKPTGATPKPTGATPKPTGATPKPTGSTPKPTGSTAEPTDSTAKPAGSTPKPEEETATALFDFQVQMEGYLIFKRGDVIRIVKKSEDKSEWWTGELNGKQGIFPGDHVSLGLVKNPTAEAILGKTVATSKKPESKAATAKKLGWAASKKLAAATSKKLASTTAAAASLKPESTAEATSKLAAATSKTIKSTATLTSKNLKSTTSWLKKGYADISRLASRNDGQGLESSANAEIGSSEVVIVEDIREDIREDFYRADDGRADDGRVDDGTAYDGAVDDGTAYDGAVDDDAVDDGTAYDGAVDDGTACDDAVDDDAVDDGTAYDGAADDGTACDDAVDDGTAYDDAVDDGTAYDDGTTCDDAVDDGTAYDDAVDDGTACDDAVDDGTACDDAVDDGTACDDADDGAADDGTVECAEEYAEGYATGDDGTADDGTVEYAEEYAEEYATGDDAIADEVTDAVYVSEDESMDC